MGYHEIRKARLQAQLTAIQAQLSALYTAITTASAQGVESYEFDSGEGRQRTTRRSLKEMTETARQLEATEMHLINELYGMGLVSVRLRRSP